MTSCGSASLLTNLTREPGAIVNVDGLVPADVIVTTTTVPGGGGGGAGAVYVKPPFNRPLWPSGLVTTTSTAPAARAGVVAVIDVALATVTLDAAVPPKETDAPAANPDPVSVTGVPPAVVPVAGEMLLNAGADEEGGGAGGAGPAARYSNASASLLVWPSGFVTTSSTLPAVPGGVVTAMDVALETLTPTPDVAPNDTVAPAANPEPEIVIAVPPPVGPDLGVIPVTEGGALAGTS